MKEPSPDVMDITIIGGGPVGLFTLFYAGMRSASTKLIESLPQLGGQLETLYPEKYIYDIAGFPKVRAGEFIKKLLEQVKRFDPVYVLNETVLHIEKLQERLFKLKTNLNTHLTKSIIIASGCGSFSPRPLSIPGSEKYEKNNFHYFIKKTDKFKNKRVLIAGGGDSAIDFALMLVPIAKEITLVHRRTKFRAHEQSLKEIEKTNTNVLVPYEIKSAHGDKNLERVIIENKQDNTSKTIDVDDIIVAFGFKSSPGPIDNFGLELTKNKCILVDRKMETSIPGIYAVGDAATYEHKVKLIAVGLGEAPIAINHAKKYIDPTSNLQPGHSSSLFCDIESKK